MKIDRIQDRITELEGQIEVWNRFNKDGGLANQIADAKDEIDKLKKQLEEEVEEKIVKEKDDEYDVIIPTHNDITSVLSSGEYAFLTKLISVSNFNDIGKRSGVDMEAYIYDNVLKPRLENLKSQGVKVPSKNTLKKHMKTFEKITIDGDNFHLMNIINTPNGIAYQFKQSYSGKYFVTIPSSQLNEMLKCLKDNPIKVYFIIARKLQIKNEYTKFTREYICKGMGLEPLESNMNDVSTYLNMLKKVGYIKIKYEWIKERTDDGETKMKQIMYIRLATYQEWKNKE